jgi:hypothetical protein
MSKRPNLKLKTQRKQFLGFFPLAFAHPELPVTLTLAVIAFATLGNETQIEIILICDASPKVAKGSRQSTLLRALVIESFANKVIALLR